MFARVYSAASIRCCEVVSMMCLSLDCMIDDAIRTSVYYGVAAGLFPILFFMLVVMFLRMR